MVLENSQTWWQGILDVLCFLSESFAIWGISLKTGLCLDSEVQALSRFTFSFCAWQETPNLLGCLPRVQSVVNARLMAGTRSQGVLSRMQTRKEHVEVIQLLPVITRK